MKDKRAALLLLVIMLVLSGCGAGHPVGREDGPFTVISCDGVEAAVYTEALDKLELYRPPEAEDGVLLELWETDSVNQAHRDKVDGPRGLVGRLLRIEADQARQRLAENVNLQVVARDEAGTLYAMELDPVGQLYRSKGITEEDGAQWERLIKAAQLMGADLHWRNPELQPMLWTGLTGEPRDIPNLPKLLKTLDDGDLIVTTTPYWHRQKMDELAQVLSLAADAPVVNRPDLSFAPLLDTKPTWSLEAVWGAKRNLLLSCWEDEAPLVSVVFQWDGLSDAVCFSDESLYNLVRHGRDGLRRIDMAASNRHRDILEDAKRDLLAEYAGDPAEYTECHLVQLTTAFTYTETERSWVEVYDVDFSLTPAHPELVELSGDMYLDGDLNVRGISDLGQLAVRYRGSEPSAEAFLGRENSFPYWEDPSERWDMASWVLNQAELGTINPVRVMFEEEADPLFLANAIPYGDADGPEARTVVIFPRYQVSNFRYFEVNPLRESGGVRPVEGDMLWGSPSLDPDKPLLVTLELSPGLPRRGFGFRVGDTYFTYGITVSGRDGALLLMDMD